MTSGRGTTTPIIIFNLHNERRRLAHQPSLLQGTRTPRGLRSQAALLLIIAASTYRKEGGSGVSTLQHWRGWQVLPLSLPFLFFPMHLSIFFVRFFVGNVNLFIHLIVVILLWRPK